MILMNLNQIAFYKHNKIILNVSGKATKSVGFDYLHPFLTQLKTMNYTLDYDTALMLSLLSEEYATDIMNNILSLVTEKIGDKEYETFYNKPMTEIKEMDIVDRYIDSIIHYLTLLTPAMFETSSLEEQKEDFEMLSKELVIQSKVNVISIAEKGYFENLLKTLLSSKVALSTTDMEILDILLNLLDVKTLNRAIKNSDVVFKEIMATAVGSLIKSNRIKVVPIQYLVKTATDVLRVISYLETGSTVIVPYMDLNLKNPQRKFILNALENMPNPEEDLMRNKLIWRDIAKLVHAKKSTHPNVVRYFEVVFDKRKVVTLNTIIEPLMAEYAEKHSMDTLKEIIAQLSKRPSEFGRRLDFLYRTALKDNQHAKQHLKLITIGFGSVAIDISSRVLYQMRNHFLDRENTRLVQVNNKMVLLDSHEPFDETIIKETIEMIDKALTYQYSQMEPLGNVYIDKRFENINITTSERSSSKGAFPLTSGSKVPLDKKGDILRLFLFWKNVKTEYGVERVDADLGSIHLNADFETISSCNFSYPHAPNQRFKTGEQSYYASHSGDIVNAPNGAAEFIDVDVEKAKAAGVRYMVMYVNAYTEQTFAEMDDIRSGFMWLNHENAGRKNPYDARLVQHSNDLTAASRNGLLFMLDLEEMNYTWLDLNVSMSYANENNAVNQVMGTTTVLAKAYKEMKSTTVKDVYELHAEARGTLVDNIEDADLVLELPEDTYSIDINSFVSDWL